MSSICFKNILFESPHQNVLWALIQKHRKNLVKPGIREWVRNDRRIRSLKTTIKYLGNLQRNTTYHPVEGSVIYRCSLFLGHYDWRIFGGHLGIPYFQPRNSSGNCPAPHNVCAACRGKAPQTLVENQGGKIDGNNRQNLELNLGWIYYYMGFSENSGFSPQIIHSNMDFHYFHHPFWGPTPIFGNTHILLSTEIWGIWHETADLDVVALKA